MRTHIIYLHSSSFNHSQESDKPKAQQKKNTHITPIHKQSPAMNSSPKKKTLYRSSSRNTSPHSKRPHRADDMLT